MTINAYVGFDRFLACLGHGYQVEKVKYNTWVKTCSKVSICYMILPFWEKIAADLMLIV